MWLRQLVAPLLRFTQPGMSACHHCGWPWSYTTPHFVRYDGGRSIFVSCEYCWPRLTKYERIDYTTEIVWGIGVGWRWNQAWDEDQAALAIAAVAKEGESERQQLATEEPQRLADQG